MFHIFSGLPGVVCMIGGILVFGQSQPEHDQRLESVFKRINRAGVTLNSEKCEFSKGSVKFLGHVIDKVGIYSDQAPTNVTELHQF